jgi:hypothetical protein
MEVFKNTPIDIVQHILCYDKRYIIRNGNIIIIKPLDKKKYRVVIHLLKNKPKLRILYDAMSYVILSGRFILFLYLNTHQNEYQFMKTIDFYTGLGGCMN